MLCLFTAHKTCEEIDEFDCYGDGSFCIPHDKVCDGHNDCQHREDEETAMCKRKFRILDELFVFKRKVCCMIPSFGIREVASSSMNISEFFNGKFCRLVSADYGKMTYEKNPSELSQK